VVDIVRLPKIDLHRHLLGSARPETLWELARRYDAQLSRVSAAEFRNAIVHGSPTTSLGKYIAPWEIFRDVVRSPADIHRIAFEAADDALRDGVKYVEFRAGLPGLSITDGSSAQTSIPASEYLSAIRRGFSEVPGIVCRLVAAVTRHAVGPAGPELRRSYTSEFFETVESFRDGFIVGVDLSGLESGWPARSFKDVFSKAQQLGLPVTIHAGETEGPAEVWAAIDALGASRIGHGTSAPRDPALVRELIARNIVLEVCPTAGWLVGAVKDIHHQPIIECAPPLPYVVCTDNPAINASRQSRELEIAAAIAGTEAVTFAQSQFEIAAGAAFDRVAVRALVQAQRS
jgi:adenosine deaminase